MNAPAPAVDYRVHPSGYRHWKLSFDGPVATLAMDVAEDAGVALSINLTGAVFVNQSAAFSDFHGTGANPAANSSLTDAAYVANRFRVVQHRAHV